MPDGTLSDTALGRFTVKAAGRDVPFVYPATGNMGSHARAIITGQVYRRPPIAGYRPQVVVDVGANIGAAAFYFLSVAPAAAYVAFEPSAANLALLRRNLEPFPAAAVVPCGLYSGDRETTLYHGANQCMQHSVVRSVETTAAGETIALRRASAEFDRLGLDRVSVLKIDTEGCEVPILRDLAPRLERIDLIYVEYHSEEDRREIDRLLGDRFLLFHAQGEWPHRGVNAYLSHRLAATNPQIDALRLSPPR